MIPMAPNENPNPTLPQDIIYDMILMILLKLPVKTLLQCMCVCKSWFSIISSNDFIKTHLSRSTNDPHFTHHHLFMHKYEAYSTFEICSVHSLLNEPVTRPIGISSPAEKEHWNCVVGCCNSLVCLRTDDDRVILWNPATRISRKLPKGPLVMISYYFCYDELEDDFKVFGTRPRGSDQICQMSAYSSKSNCWRKIGDFTFVIQYGVVCANGAFYWAVDFVMQCDYPKFGIIISLDIETGTYREVLQPKYAEGTYNVTFSTFGKSLCAGYFIKETSADFWVMNNCGVEESWIKLFTISYGDGLASDRFLAPLCICVNGDIMFSSESQILLYNSKDNSFKVLVETSLEHNEVYAYVESLVSPIFKQVL